ncbi:hypothetical protein [Desulfolithobacter sp.]
MRRYLRQFVFLVYGLLLRWPLWLLIWALGRTGMIKTLFLVYPTDDTECTELCPNISWLRRFFSARPTPAGLIMDGWLPVGIYFVIPDPPMQLMLRKNRSKAETILRRMLWIRKLTGARAVGLAGQLGPIFEKRHNIPIEPPFYGSTLGNIFSIQEAVNHMAARGQRRPWQVSVAILGGGELGEMLERHLGADGYRTVMVDVRYTRKGAVKLMDAQETDRRLQGVDYVVNLLPRGRDFMACRLHRRIPEHATIIDFSRPAIPADQLVQTVVMGNRVHRRGMQFFMELPGGWQRHELPACSVPSLLASLGGYKVRTMEELRLAARQMAFGTALAVRPVPFSEVLGNRFRGLAGELSLGRLLLFVRKSLRSAT